MFHRRSARGCRPLVRQLDYNTTSLYLLSTVFSPFFKIFLFFFTFFVFYPEICQKCHFRAKMRRFATFQQLQIIFGQIFFDKNRAAPLSVIFPGYIAANSRNRRTNPIRNAPQHNNICAHTQYMRTYTHARVRARILILHLFICVYLRHIPPPVTPRIIIACAKTRVKSLRTAQKNERFRIQSKPLVCPTPSKNRFGRIFSQFHSGGFSGAKNKISYFARISATIFPVSANFSSISETSFSCVRQRTRLCPSYFVAK